MTSETLPKLRIGLLVDSPCVSKYIYYFVLWASGQSNIEISHLIIHKDTKEVTSAIGRLLKTLRQEGIERTLARMIFRVVVTMESFLLIKRNKKHREHFTSVDISHLVADSVTITPKVSRSGYVQRFSNDDVASVAGLGLDVLIRFGTGILRGDILHAAKHGIISFHHADNRVMRGGPSGFWEVYYRWDKTGFIIQKLTEELDGGIVLKRGSFPTQFSYLLNQVSLHRKSYVHLQNLISGIARTGQLPPAEEPAPYSAMPFTVPSTWRSLRYAAYLASALLIKTLAKLANYQRRWSISYIRCNWRSAVLWRSHTIRNPAGRFLADPFVLTKEGRTYCFAEDYVYKTGRGHISVVEIAGDGPKQVQPCLKEPFHLSFPYLFYADGTLYMCPETSAKREIRVYRCMDFPHEWKLERTLMRDVCAVDTMLFEHGGSWWMFTNIDPCDSGQYGSELYLFYADSALSTEWTAHPLNPVLIDADCGRNAGFIVEKDRRFRVAQRQGFDTYGKGISVFEIEVLSKTDYRERKVCGIEPHYKRSIYGTHHLTTTGDITVIDHVSKGFVR